jgi:hypothetical protein
VADISLILTLFVQALFVQALFCSGIHVVRLAIAPKLIVMRAM